MRRLVLVALLATTIAVPAHAQVRVGIDIGIQLPAPPPLVVIPESPVYYAPSAPANVFSTPTSTGPSPKVAGMWGPVGAVHG